MLQSDKPLSIQIEVQRRGLELKLFATAVHDKLLPKIVKAAAEYGYATMVSWAPVRSGRLMGSIEKHVQGVHGSVGLTVPYAIYVEYGTAPHIIQPIFSRVLAFEVEGRMVFTSIVRHPGTKPQPFVRKTAEDVRQKIPELWKNVFDEEVSQ
jgi:HK97 gp10 family phage protein